MMLDKFMHGTWRKLLDEEFKKTYMKTLEDDILTMMLRHDEFYPSINQVFRAFDLCPYENTRVVIIGQNPYLDLNTADGLAFSSKKEGGIPPSLLNIFKALKNDLGCYIPNNGNLEPWAAQGVLLLNSILISTIGNTRYQFLLWQIFTDKIVELLNDHERSLVFMLWGKYAHRKSKYIDKTKHLVLKHNHPSPIIACNTFTTCDHFSRCNTFLYETTPSTINWQISNI